MESTVSRVSKGAKFPSFTAAEIASSTRWLRGMKAGLAARIAERRWFASPRSSASRCRHLTTQSSKELGSVNSVTPHVIDGAIDRPWVIDVHEGAGAVVDGLARYRHVVGVHDAVNEAHEQPICDELGLAPDHQVEECA